MMNPYSGAVKYLKIFRRHVGKRLYVVLALTVCSAISGALGIAFALPLFATLDVSSGAEKAMPHFFGVILDTLGIRGSVIGVLLLISSMFVVKGLIQFASNGYTGILQEKLVRALQEKLFDACNQMSYSYYVSRDTGHFVNVINRQVNGFFRSFAAYMTFLTQAINACVYVGIAIFLSWKFGLLALLGGVILLPLFRGLNQYVKDLSKEEAKEGSELNKQLVQALHAFKYFASTCRGERTRRATMASIRRAAQYRRRQSLWAAFTQSISEPLSVLMIVAILFVQITVIREPIAPILVSMLLFYKGMNAMLWIQKAWQVTLSTIGSVYIVEGELDALARNREGNGISTLGALKQGVEFRDVHFSYGDETEVIKGISLSIPVRTTVALVGGSGAGKSTIVDLLTLLLKPQSGKVVIDGVKGDEVELKSWRSQIGYVSQETVIFDDSIAANIALEDVNPESAPETFERVKAAARKAHIAHFIDEMPEGYFTQVGDRGVRLSGGQRQRLFIARELFKRPNLLILDEATSALDSESERAIQNSIDELRGEMTLVIIAHRLSTIRNVDRVYVLEGGKVVEEGTFDELRERQDSRFHSMVNLQVL